MSDRVPVLTEPFDNSVAHAICSLSQLYQHSAFLTARWQSMGRVLSPSNAQRQYNEVKCALRFFLFPFIPVE